MSAPEFRITPQEGPQTEFLESVADIVFYGGGAGGGKTYALLLDPLRHYENGEFGAVIFRRSTTQVRNQGGMWDESQKLYPMVMATPRESILEWTFPSGMAVKFSHLEYDKTVYDWQGSQIPMIGFDEITHFSEFQFFYMLSRNRSSSGVPGYIRATCNPDADSWVRKFVDWWIGPDGFAIKERSGIVRWFIRQNDTLVWGDSKEELIEKYGTKQIPKSFTFIPALLSDNKILMENDPSYVSNLHALPKVERERLLGGNWNIRPTAGNYFKREYFEVLNTLPAGWIQCVRFWDRAATKPSPANSDPDWTRGLKLYKYPNGVHVVGDLKSLRDSPYNVEQLIKTTASQDKVEVRIVCQQDPGSAGVAEAQNFIRMLNGYDVHTRPFSKDKATRAKPVSAQCEARNVKVLRGDWNEEFFVELENFPEGKHDDIVDTFSGAYNEMNEALSIFDVL